MLHLAQVTGKEHTYPTELRLLARQISEHSWQLLDDVVCSIATDTLRDGSLVLLDFSEAGEVLSLQDATPWILELIETYLVKGLTPGFFATGSRASRTVAAKSDLPKSGTGSPTLRN